MRLGRLGRRQQMSSSVAARGLRARPWRRRASSPPQQVVDRRRLVLLVVALASASRLSSTRLGDRLGRRPCSSAPASSTCGRGAAGAHGRSADLLPAARDRSRAQARRPARRRFGAAAALRARRGLRLPARRRRGPPARRGSARPRRRGGTIDAAATGCSRLRPRRCSSAANSGGRDHQRAAEDRGRHRLVRRARRRDRSAPGCRGARTRRSGSRARAPRPSCGRCRCCRWLPLLPLLRPFFGAPLAAGAFGLVRASAASARMSIRPEPSAAGVAARARTGRRRRERLALNARFCAANSTESSWRSPVHARSRRARMPGSAATYRSRRSVRRLADRASAR